ncbi:hypothetical protein GF345_00365 [Candidatus Woesearchaeota archaeon]|nr:hypothetical protein [Candidatus Woesearchaeota archaeon]
MEFKINIEKKHFWALMITIAVIMIGVFAYAQAVGNTQGHPWSEISDIPIESGTVTTGGADSATAVTFQNTYSDKPLIKIYWKKPTLEGDPLDWMVQDAFTDFETNSEYDGIYYGFYLTDVTNTGFTIIQQPGESNPIEIYWIAVGMQ